MELTLHTSQGLLLVRAATQRYLTIGESDYNSSLILLPDAIHSDWGISASEQLTGEHASLLLKHRPELVILGTGTKLVFPRQEFNYTLMRNGVGCEVMDTRAACRTYNVLASEGRRVLGAFIQVAD
jgi:uncharacterized protein